MAGLYNGVFIMADRQTGSIWTHYDGAVLQGELADAGVQLEIQPIVHTTWGEWKAAHPDTRVLDWYPEYATAYRTVEPGLGGLGPTFQRTILNWDDRLAENELVLGAGVDTSFTAYVLGDMPEGVNVISDVLGGHPIVVFANPATDYALAFSAMIDGTVRQFEVEAGVIVDETGTAWGLSGEATEGPDAGLQLDYVTSFVTEWYGWAAYHPDTTIYGR